MIWSQARVLLADGKTRSRIEVLRVGQHLMNPLTGAAQELCDIRKRDPRIGPGATWPPEMVPCLIRAHSLGPGRPSVDLWLSPSQHILTPKRNRQGKTILTPSPARILATNGPPPLGRYVALILKEPGLIFVEGLALIPCDLERLEQMRRQSAKSESLPQGR